MAQTGECYAHEAVDSYVDDNVKFKNAYVDDNVKFKNSYVDDNVNLYTSMIVLF